MSGLTEFQKQKYLSRTYYRAVLAPDWPGRRSVAEVSVGDWRSVRYIGRTQKQRHVKEAFWSIVQEKIEHINAADDLLKISVLRDQIPESERKTLDDEFDNDQIRISRRADKTSKYELIIMLSVGSISSAIKDSFPGYFYHWLTDMSSEETYQEFQRLQRAYVSFSDLIIYLTAAEMGEIQNIKTLGLPILKYVTAQAVPKILLKVL